MTLGEYRVGVTFNPGDNAHVDEIKRRTADLIDYINAIPKSEGEATLGEFLRLMALASTHYEDAAMWAVKAVTKPARE
jgi:predicted MarR family transcription regulator